MVLATPILPSPDLYCPLSYSLSEGVEAGLWDHREAERCGSQPGASVSIPHMGSSGSSQQTPPVQAQSKQPGGAQSDREPLTV